MLKKVIFVGHSHINCIKEAAGYASPEQSDVSFIQLRDAKYGSDSSTKLAPAKFDSCNLPEVVNDLTKLSDSDTLFLLCPNGNEHSIVSLVPLGNLTVERLEFRLDNLLGDYRKWVDLISRNVNSVKAVLPPPPPIESEQFILDHPGRFAERVGKIGVAPSFVRLAVYRHQVQLIKEFALNLGLEFLDLPGEVFDADGFLDERYYGKDPTHANTAYGQTILKYVFDFVRKRNGVNQMPRKDFDAQPANASEVAPSRQPRREHPYIGLPNSAFWKQSVAQIPVEAFDPVVRVPFRISRTDKVATAGSCFAQHISKRLRSGGFNFMAMESAMALSDGESKSVDYDFSARYGNVYTARQLLQLFDRVYDDFRPVDDCWSLPNGRFCDSFRPRIKADGYPSEEALVEDRKQHFSAVRQMFEQLDVFVFTLGLTECWVSKVDGAAYPLAPGVAGGVFDSARYEFVNFGVADVVRDLNAFLEKLRIVNPGAKLILTVSPVPLAATYTGDHVLVSTTYSKSVLRVAAEMVSQTCEGVYYFPSYEIISGSYNRGRYFGPDLREVTEEGVNHVMSVFMRHLTDGEADSSVSPSQREGAEADAEMEEMIALAEAACDEELLAKD